MHLTNPLANILGEGFQEKLNEDRRARIEFHRRYVRNGPVKSRGGQKRDVRRTQRRASKRLERRTYRDARRRHIAEQQESSRLFWRLQLAGILPTMNPGLAPPGQVRKAVIWLVDNYYPHEIEDVNEELVRVGLFCAYARWQILQGLPASGSLPKGYQLPVRVV